MTLSESEEGLPLIDRNRRDQQDFNVDYHSLRSNSKRTNALGDTSLGGQNVSFLCNCSNQLCTTQPTHRRYPNESITYSWSNLNVHGISKTENVTPWQKIRSIATRQERVSSQPRHILKDVYGVAYPGELLAIMGASGAGKTTLLNALTYRSGQDSIVRGYRRLNGFSVDQDTIARLSAYVEQDNLFVGTLSVKEHLIFQSLVRIDRNVPYRQKLKRVEDVIIELGLQKCANTIIGYEGRTKGISGGEKKRLSFASEILTNPPMMFCDEPTSGLDSFMALNVINVLKSMAIRGKTVICTIHQPSSEIFSLFDKILLVAEGRTAFLGKSAEAISFFAELGASPPANYNPADFFIQLLAVVPNREQMCKNTIETICSYFDQSAQGLELATKIECTDRNEVLDDNLCSWRRRRTLPSSLPPEEWTYPATWLCQFRALFWRSWISVIKEPLLVKVRLFQTVKNKWPPFERINCKEKVKESLLADVWVKENWENDWKAQRWRNVSQIALAKCTIYIQIAHCGRPTVLSLMVGLIYHGQKLNENGVMNINGVLFTFLTNMTFQNLFAVISVFCSELPVFMKEHSNKLYRVDAYFLSKTLAEVPMFVAIPIIFTSITYYWIGLNPKLFHFLFTILILILVTNVATSFGYLISCISTNVVMALSIGPPIVIPFLLFGGFLLSSGSIPAYFEWLSFLSWFKYGNEALLINQWSDVKLIECNVSDIICPRNGEIVLEMYHFDEKNFWWDIGSLVILILLFRSLAFLALLLKTARAQRCK